MYGVRVVRANMMPTADGMPAKRYTGLIHAWPEKWDDVWNGQEIETNDLDTSRNPCGSGINFFPTLTDALLFLYTCGWFEVGQSAMRRGEEFWLVETLGDVVKPDLDVEHTLDDEGRGKQWYVQKLRTSKLRYICRLPDFVVEKHAKRIHKAVHGRTPAQVRAEWLKEWEESCLKYSASLTDNALQSIIGKKVAKK